MSVMMSKDKKELIITCKCKCGNTVHFCKIEDTDCPNKKLFRVIGEKLKKILAVIRNRDFYYSDILMSKEDFHQFKEYINQFGE